MATPSSPTSPTTNAQAKASAKNLLDQLKAKNKTTVGGVPVTPQVQPMSQPAPSLPYLASNPANVANAVAAAGVAVNIKASPSLLGSGLYGRSINYGAKSLADDGYEWLCESEPLKLEGTSDQIHVGILSLDVKPIRFMLNVWKASVKPEPGSFAFMHSHNTIDLVRTTHHIALVFLSEQKRDEFKQWMADYQKRFNVDCVTEMYPGVKHGEKMSVNIFSTKREDLSFFDNTSEREDLFNQWVWIVANTHDSVRLLSDFWLFENESEMLIFKMRDKE